ncbi:hypothetical protein V7195_18670 [Priestia megaterium]|uniref:hypothetical protein n=1 Tax=Priestia megaterium TaxID=1404 RepID=UPI000BF444DE|nr:hypothetical protein [Priestia megaterium]PFJ96509.1 hypothetical protein COI96_24720 [Priestia megaterium]
MKGTLKCSVDIEIDGGDGEFIIADKDKSLTINIGLAAITLPNLFSNLISLSSGKQTKFKLEQYGSGDYYLFVRDSNRIRIEEVRKPGGRDTYVFNFFEFLLVLEKGFDKFFAKLRRDGVLPLSDDKDEFMCPINEDVINSFNHFSKSLK